MRRFALLAALPAILALAGCLKDTRVVKLNADGSGTITTTTLMKTASLEKMKEMAKAFGGAEGKQPDLFSEEQAKAAAAKMGEGVEFVSCEKLKTADEEGLKAVYSFKDVSKLKVSDEPNAPETGMPTAPKGEKKAPITFKFAKQANGNSLLTIVNPDTKEFKKPEKEEKAEDQGDAQLGMMKEIFGGFKICIQLEVAGKIVKTNTPHVNGSTVTILEMDFDKMFADTEKFKKLSKAQPQSLEEAKALLKDFPGVKVCMEPEVTVEFSGN